MSLLAMVGGVALLRLLRRQHRARPGLTPLIHRLDGQHIFEGLLDSTHALASTLFEWLFTPRLQPQILLIISATFIVAMRSEEHTSELQSLMRISYQVFC